MKTLTAVIKKSKKDGLFYAHLVSSNGKKQWDTGDGYSRRSSAVAAVENLKKRKIGKTIFQ